MKIHLISIIITSLSCLPLLAQNLWVTKFNGPSFDETKGLATDAFGNVYSTGKYGFTVDFNPGPGVNNLTNSGSDIFVSKLNANGGFVWAKSINGTSEEVVNSISVDAVGNSFITGAFRLTMDFDPGPGTYNLMSNGNIFDIFVCKLNSSGDFVWARHFGGSAVDEGYDIDVDSKGNVYVTGFFEGTVDFDPGVGTTNLTSFGNRDVFVLKLSSLGNLIWVKQFGGTDKDVGTALKVDNTGNVYFTGYFKGTADFDPGLSQQNYTAVGWDDAFISKLDSLGNHVWAKQLSGPSEDEGHGLILDGIGNVITIGHFMGQMDFDPGIGMSMHRSKGKRDVYVHKLNSAGNFVWAKTFGGSNEDYGNDIATDLSGSLYCTGVFIGKADLDPYLTKYEVNSIGGTNSSEAYVCKLDQTGNFLWGDRFGRAYGDNSFAIATDFYGGVYFSGYSFLSTNNTEAFIVKKSQCQSSAVTSVLSTCDSLIAPSGSKVWLTSGIYHDTTISVAGCDTLIRTISLSLGVSSTVNQTISSCGPFVSPSGKHIWTQTGNYSDTIFSPLGCDIIVNISLAVTDIDTTISASTSGLMANEPSATYQWMFCDSSTVSGETSQMFTPTLNGSYAVIISKNGCTDTSACMSYHIGLEEAFASHLKVYPNPTTDKFIIEFDELYRKIDVVIRDAIGNEVFSETYTKSETISLNSYWAPGVYTIAVKNEKGDRAHFKIVKQ